MAGGTHGFDMIKKLRENENLRKRRNYFKAKERYQLIERDLKIDYKTANSDQRQLLRRELVKRQQHERIAAIITLFVLGVVAIMIIIIVWMYFRP